MSHWEQLEFQLRPVSKKTESRARLSLPRRAELADKTLRRLGTRSQIWG